MQTSRSIAEVLSKLEVQAGFHREREAFHARQEEMHRQERSHHAGELAQIEQRLESFRAAAAAALDIADRLAAPAAEDEAEDFGPAYRPKLVRMVTRVIEPLEGAARFGCNWVTAEVNRRFGKGLRRPVKARQISIVLRRMARTGRIHLVRAGRPHHEALYTREPAG
jgi:hypothetical protein